jgi:hypothetical protein
VGVWTLSHILGDWEFRLISAWAKREAKTLCPAAKPDDPRMFLRLDADHELPPRPNRYSGRYTEWDELRFSNEYINRPRKARSRIAFPNGGPASSTTPKPPGILASLEAQLREARRAQRSLPDTQRRSTIAPPGTHSTHPASRHPNTITE